MFTTAGSNSAIVDKVTFWSGRSASSTTATGVLAGRCSAKIARASGRWCRRVRLRGLYSTVTRSASAAARTRRRMVSQSVCRSDSEMVAWSWPSGAPRIAEDAKLAVTPGTTSMSMPSVPCSNVGEAIA